MSTAAIRTIVFDLDDTLIATAPLYERAIDLAVKRVVDAFPGTLPYAAVRELQEEIDIAAVSRYGFSADRFPWSLAETARQAAARSGLTCPPELEHELRALGNAIYDDVPELFPDTFTVLDALRGRYELILYTLGITAIQDRKIDYHRLRPYFSAVHIVSRKNTEQLAAVIAPRPPASVLVAGDSLRGEVAPAAALGCHAVYVRAFAPWRYNTVVVPGPYTTITAIGDLLPLLGGHAPAGQEKPS